MYVTLDFYFFVLSSNMPNTWMMLMLLLWTLVITFVMFQQGWLSLLNRQTGQKLVSDSSVPVLRSGEWTLIHPEDCQTANCPAVISQFSVSCCLYLALGHYLSLESLGQGRSVNLIGSIWLQSQPLPCQITSTC